MAYGGVCCRVLSRALRWVLSRLSVYLVLLRDDGDGRVQLLQPLADDLVGLKVGHRQRRAIRLGVLDLLREIIAAGFGVSAGESCFVGVDGRHRAASGERLVGGVRR